jgi:hypothetical protein
MMVQTSAHADSEKPAPDAGGILERDTAVIGTADDATDPATDDGRSASTSAQGDDDTPPPKEGSPRG